LWNSTDEPIHLLAGTRIGQILPESDILSIAQKNNVETTGLQFGGKLILQNFVINIGDMRLIGIKLTGRVVGKLLVVDFKVMIELFILKVLGIIRIILMIHFTIIAILLFLYLWFLLQNTYEGLNLSLANPAITPEQEA